MNKIYPEEVLAVAERIVDIISPDLFIDNDISDIDLGRRCGIEVVNELFLKKFLEGTDLIIDSEYEAENMFNSILTNCHLCSLEQKGMIGSYYDEERGEEYYFATELGKNRLNDLLQDEKDVESI